VKFLTIVLVLILVGCEAAQTGDSISRSTSNQPATSAITPSPASTQASGNTAVSPAPKLSPLPPDAPGVQAAIDVVHEYYDAINAPDYRKAYELWSGKGQASGQTFEQFRDGFANTASVDIDTSGEPGDLEGAAGSQYVTIPLLIKAKTKDGREQNFWGEYVLRRSMVDGATAEQRSWKLYSAEIRER
jgi:hypothetical protein